MKKGLALILTLVLVFTTVIAMPVTASAASKSKADCTKKVYYVDTYAELFDAVKDSTHDRTIILEKDIMVGYDDGRNDYMSSDYQLNVTGDKTLVLDLNGHQLGCKSKRTTAFINISGSGDVYIISSAAGYGVLKMDMNGGDSNTATVGPAIVKVNSTGSFYSWRTNYYFGKTDITTLPGSDLGYNLIAYIDKNKPCNALIIEKAKKVVISDSFIENVYKVGKGLNISGNACSADSVIIEKSRIVAGGNCIELQPASILELYDVEIRSILDRYAVYDRGALSTATMAEVMGHNLMSQNKAVKCYRITDATGTRQTVYDTTILSKYPWIAFDATNIDYDQTYSVVADVSIPQGHISLWYETDGFAYLGKHTMDGDACKFCNYSTKVSADLFDDSDIVRVKGSTRYGTSAEISESFVAEDDADAIIIVNGTTFPDALAAGPFAKSINAPILMVNGKDAAGKLDAAVKAEIDRIDSNHNAKLYIIGGTGAVSDSFVRTFENMGYTGIERVKGSNRYKTAIELAKRAGGKTAFITNSENYPDALGAGSAAALNDGVILFTQKDKLSADTAAYLQESDFDKIIILGGTGVVSDTVANQLKAICSDVTRVKGAGRCETSVEVAKKFFPTTDTIVVATAWNFADALAGGPFASDLDAPIILLDTKKDVLKSDMIQYVEDANVEHIVVLGGTGAVSDKLYADLENLLK